MFFFEFINLLIYYLTFPYILLEREIKKNNTGILSSINLVNVRFSKEKEKNPTDSTKVIYKVYNTLNLNMSLNIGKIKIKI